MKFGILYETQRPYQGNDLDWNSLYKETLDQCELADQLGFDNLWFVEHHFLLGFSGSPCPEVLFGALSQRTKNIRIGFGVSILPSHHPIHIAERVAMVDQLTDGRVEFGTGRSNAYEQVGQGIDPRETRERWDEALTMLPKMWQSDEFSWEGKHWNVPTRRILPRVFQKPHPRMYLACTQTESFRLAAQKGIGVLSSASYAVDILAEHVKVYRDAITDAEPVGAFVNNFWGNNVHAYCGKDDQAAKELAAESMKTFFGPDKPYIQGRINAYEELLEAWGGVPDDLNADFSRWLRQSDDAHKQQAEEAGLSLDAGPGAARAAKEIEEKKRSEKNRKKRREKKEKEKRRSWEATQGKKQKEKKEREEKPERRKGHPTRERAGEDIEKGNIQKKRKKKREDRKKER